MEKKIQKYIEQHSLLKPNDRLLIGVSGGADSRALLHILHSLGYEIIIAHCNFQLRGEESNRDEKFVKNLAQKYDLPYRKVNFETKEYASANKISIEMAARKLRYQWFEETRLIENADWIVVAHHSNDTVETVLMNLTRGTGINGLTGIKPQNGFIIRPLLSVSRNEILEYLKQQNLPFVNDSTNQDTTFVRNRFREEIIPDFEAINPSFSENILQTTSRLNDVALIYNDYVQKAKKQIVSKKNDSLYISLKKLKQEKIKNTILYEILKDFDFNPEQSADIINNIDRESGKQFFSPTHRLIKDRENLIIVEKKPSTKKQEKSASVKMEFFEIDENFKIDTSSNIAFFDADKIKMPLTIRYWQQGDTFYPLGMNNKKKVSDYFIDKKKSLIAKENTQILVNSENEILWIVGERIDNRFRITPETKKVLKITCE